ncbi:hypothetical protein JOQ06_026514, partial [Pogonophryne albipinna]
MSLFLEELIHPDQACAVPGRKITDSLLLIRDTICLARDRNFRLVVLNLDFEKAFDRVSHQYLFQEREPVSPVHGLAFGEPSTVWCNVNHPTLTNRLRDMSWMVAHEILPVRSVMHSRGMAANSTCPRPGCGAPETVRHLLWECSAAVDQWAKAGSLKFPCLPAREVLTAQLILYGVSQKQDCSRDFSKQWLTLAAIKDAIWTSRNLLVRRHMQIPPVAVIQMAAATIKSATRHAQDTATKKNRLCAHSDEGAGATRERKDISNHEEKGAMAGRADDGQPIPRVGLRFTLRFQAVDAAEDVVSRTWFCRKVIMEQLNLKVDAIYCLQWNRQEKAFDVTLKDEQRVLAASSTRLPSSALEQIEGTYSTRASQLSAGDAGNRAMWMEGAAALNHCCNRLPWGMTHKEARCVPPPLQGVLGLKPLCQGILEWWEVAKDRIKTFCLGYCKRKARQSKREMSHLQRLLEREYAKGNCGSTINQDVCDSLKARLRHVSEGKARAFLARSRSEFIEQSETCSAAFFSSVREKKARQVVTGFRDSQGIVVTEECQVVRVATDHFRDSFKEKDVGRGDDFLELLERQVPGDIVQALELPLTVSELEGALNRMNKGKVPGIDGLPVELYAKFWSILGPVLLEKGDRTEIGNWRPLTMLCVDYKLLAKVLTDRLGEAMPHLVHVDQTCAVPGRSTRWNLQLLRDAIAWAEDRNLPLMLVALDQTKAFDRVQWRFMFSILERLGFGKVFIRWLRTLYMDVGSSVVVNGYLGDVFRLQSGVRQGCPLSPLLYVLYMEPLAAAIRADKGVRGFLVPGSGGLRVKLSQYADDTTLLLDRDECLIRSLQIMEEFGRASGSKLNCAKSSVKFFGKWRERMDVPGGLAFCPGPIKVLGVMFESAKSASLSWARRLEVVERKVSLWKSRQLTFIGKVLVLKVDILPSLVYLAYIYPLPVSMRRPLMRLLFGFIWGGRYEYVARGRMLAGVEAGGRDVPHLTLKMDCIFVSTLCREVSGPVVHPSGFFIRLFFSYQARELMAWSNLGPRAEQQPWHYRHAAKWLRAHPEAAGPEVKLNHRTLYKEAREKINVGPVIGIPSKVWRRIQPKGLDNRLKDLNWLCLLRCLSVRKILHRHGLARSPVCPRPDCKDEETIRYVMWDCPFAQGAWRRVEGWLGQSFLGFKITWDGIERGSGPGKFW